MVFEFNNYRSFLKGVLSVRKAKNKRYSLRALAKDLGLLPAHLSAIYSGKRGLSLQNALNIAIRLGLAAKEREYFLTLVQFDAAKSPELKGELMDRVRELNKSVEIVDLNVDLFHAIADWYHIPIMEMTDMKGMEFTPKNIARKLNISALDVELALERLLRLGLLEKDERGKYRKSVDNYLFKSDIANEALRKFHRQMLEKGIESLTTQSPQEKFIATETLAFDAADLEEAKNLFREFKKKLVELAAKGKERENLYHFSFQFFNLTPEGRKK